VRKYAAAAARVRQAVEERTNVKKEGFQRRKKGGKATS